MSGAVAAAMPPAGRGLNHHPTKKRKAADGSSSVSQPMTKTRIPSWYTPDMDPSGQHRPWQSLDRNQRTRLSGQKSKRRLKFKARVPQPAASAGGFITSVLKQEGANTSTGDAKL